MGITSSCICSGASVSNGNVLKKKIKGTKTAIVLDSDGNTREVKLPAKSGEIMIEELGHVITPVEELRRTGRVSALLADEELVAGKVYLLLPVNRVNSKASEYEMGIAEKQSGKTKGRKGNKSNNNLAQVSPSLISKLSETEKENEIDLFSVCPRKQKRWNPVLDPILESPCSSQFSSYHREGPKRTTMSSEIRSTSHRRGPKF